MPACLDESQLLERTNDNHELLQRLVKAFTDQAPAMLADARVAAGNRDARAIIIAGHGMKGTFATMAASRAAALANEFERAGRAGDCDAAGRVILDLEEEVAAILAALAAIAIRRGLRGITGDGEGV